MTKEMTMIHLLTPRTLRQARLAALLAALAAALLVLSLGAAAAVAATAAPGWTLDSFAAPTSFSAADNGNCATAVANGRDPQAVCDSYILSAQNAGAQLTDGSPVTVTDSLPPGLTVQKISFFWLGAGADAAGLSGASNGVDLADFGVCDTTSVSCTFPLALQPDDTLRMVVYVTVDDPSAAGTLTNSATVTGGGAPAVSTTSQNPVGSPPPPFGASGFSSFAVGQDGQPSTQAGGHPYELDTRIDFANAINPVATNGAQTGPNSVEFPKDIAVDLPLGFLGSALATPQCSFDQLSTSKLGGGCPPDTVVGHIFNEPISNAIVNGPIFNMVPEHGVAAEFGYVDALRGAHALYARVVPTAAGYVLRTTSVDVPEVSFTDLVVNFYGNPAVRDGSGNTPVALFTNPSDCTGRPLTTTLHMDSWEHPGRLSVDGTPDLSDPNWKSASSESPAVTGCDRLQFSSTLSAKPDTSVADSPSGLDVDIRVPQSEDPSALATPPLKRAVVALPAGFTVNPGSADGLGACTPAEIALGSASSPACPESSKVGTVELQSPLLPGTLAGSIYLASQFDNPFHSLVAGYVVVDDPATGVVIKIPGNLTPDPVTGQITGVFDNNPQFPFSDLKLHFKGGPRGVLATPESCGTFTTNASFSPWSAPDSGPDLSLSDPFQISSGCVSGFQPSFTAGTQSPQAGAYSPFVLSLSRSDTDQNLQGLSVKLPLGMVAKLAGVQECSEEQLGSISSAPGTGAAQAANPSCPAGSQVGTVQTGSGVGPDPLFLAGKAYLTGPYKGAPYGLAVVVPALAGPFDLGTVVVRQALYIDPSTAQVTAVSDPFPTILDGIPLRLRRVDVDLNRPDFTLNPTNCNPMSINATTSSTGGLTATPSSRFQVGGCQELGFTPKLQMSLTGKGQTRSATHPTLTANLTQPGGQANIASTKVTLPLSLALDPKNSNNVCNYDTAQAVHGGPVGCPASTIVGKATANTTLLSQPLTGPVYLVQGIRFGRQGQRIHTLPSLLIPLRGQIALDLRAQSSVSGGKLVTTFPTIPDAPVSKFTLQINGGRNGILVITGRGRTICGKPQTANANFGAQSGKQESLSPRLSTSACRGVHKKTKHHKRSKKRAPRHSADVVDQRA
jgi:hypothetical protein